MQRGMVTDPVCGLEVNPREAPYTSTYQGHTYYFTDPDCKRMFDENPEAYASEGMPQRAKTYGGQSAGSKSGTTRQG